MRTTPQLRRFATSLAAIAVLALACACGTQVAEPPGSTPTQSAVTTQVSPTPSPTEVASNPPTEAPATTNSPTETPKSESTQPPSPEPSVPAPTPSVPAPTPSVPAPTPSAPSVSLGNFGTATLEHFAVTLKPNEFEGSAEHASFQIQVCVRKAADPASDGTTRVSTDPWRLDTSTGTSLKARPSGSFKPAFPAESRLKVGDCVSGWIEFVNPSDGFSTKLRYSNAMGEQAVWTFS